ncbi:YheC/YheD family protein [Mechercharimyces sp. CAU 1602]|uniref:YheC/YheD family protein n=1 Tax=Mechercharimyces sp. CAU 1602 TaxID=2973933 RepID=UPI0021628921|nr:YheC/YheD family protein [Mechercharimyces sp. CAU 1602]
MRILSVRPSTRRHTPDWKVYKCANLKQMLQKHPFLYVKPDGGGQGYGIARVWRTNQGKYHVKTLHRQATFSSIQPLHRYLKSNKRYIIQQGINSTTRTGHPFDLRIHTLRMGNRWIVAGIMAKVGPRNHIVTNRHQGATCISVKRLLSKHLGYSPKQCANMIRQIKKLSIEAATQVGHSYPKVKRLGVDIGIDAQNHIWFYEINTTPGIHVFRALPNKKLYYKILYLERRKW